MFNRSKYITLMHKALLKGIEHRNGHKKDKHTMYRFHRRLQPSVDRNYTSLYLSELYLEVC